MSRIGAWFDRCAILWKARKPKNPQDLAASMDKMLGPSSYGDRKVAAEHYAKHGRNTALTFGSHPEGSPERLAFEFARDSMKLSRAQSKTFVVKPHEDSLARPIDQEHIDHYAEKWASHNELLEHVPRGKELESGMRSMDGKTPVQMRTRTVSSRIQHMKKQGHKEPFATMDDLRTIHTGVEHAINSGKISTGDANRYHVMRHAVKLLSDRHAESYPGLPFKPSYAAMDTAALRVMKTGVEHLDETGFRETKQRLGGMLGSALESHDVHPTEYNSQKASHDKILRTPYPALHEIGSPEHERQQGYLKTFHARVGRSRNEADNKATYRAVAEKEQAKAKATEPAPLEMPKSYQDFRDRQDRGETFDPKVVAHMERERRMKKSLFDDWKAWRGEAA